MSDSDVYLSSASSTESCYTPNSNSREEMEVKLLVRFSPTNENRLASDEDFEED